MIPNRSPSSDAGYGIIRGVPSVPQRTSTAAVLMLLGALPFEAELHKRRLSLVHSVINYSENQSLKVIVQRQLACAFNNKNSFFHEVAEILQKYKLPTLCQLATCNQSKLQWKHICTRAIYSFWTDHLNIEIKTNS